ncbi:Signal transduction histidine kinase [Alkalispirochaeta americana]|uniref:histidine kinase n=1 Tax=Alkalispirochaeta americana TaxID=159291 RepID=A0A1N6UCS2_9SPIO|nr:histidine kinase [Alkalispirochaeta americana]SIQ63271.1 Signal transduction histidine kinase [Alkalispirochaeta americana]
MQTQRVLLSFTILLLYVAAIPLSNRVGEGLPPQWINYTVPSILLCCSLVIPQVKQEIAEVIRLILLGIQLALTYVILQPLGDALLLDVILLMAAAMSVALYGSVPTALTLGALLLATLLFRSRPPKVWDMAVQQPLPQDVAMTAVIVGSGFLTAFAAARGDTQRRKVLADARYQNQTIRKLVEANMEYQRYALDIEQSARQKERERITREVHDAVGYAFTNQRMVLEAAIVLMDRNREQDRDRLASLVRDAARSLAEGYQEVRAALHRLRRVERGHQTLETRLLHLTRHFSAVSGVTITPRILLGQGQMPPPLEEIFFRCAQEGITNAFCHGQATEVTLILRADREGFYLTVLDDGRGSGGSIQEGIGLRGMRERLEPWGGTLQTSAMERGFSLQVYLPRPPAHRPPAHRPPAHRPLPETPPAASEGTRP